MFVTCPGLYPPCRTLATELEAFMGKQCDRAWVEALTRPRLLLAKLINQSTANAHLADQKDELNDCLASIADACLLSTGFPKSRQAKATKAAN